MTVLHSASPQQHYIPTLCCLRLDIISLNNNNLKPAPLILQASSQTVACEPFAKYQPLGTTWPVSG